MGFVFEEITLRNSTDVSNATSGIINESNIRQKTVKALVDTGCYSVVITEKLCRELGLRVMGKKGASLANNERIICEQTDGVEIRWKDRYTILPALVVPDRPNVLLGALPLEAMDLIVDPVRQEVTGAHGDEWVNYI
jgi:clan AA aspartic protease